MASGLTRPAGAQSVSLLLWTICHDHRADRDSGMSARVVAVTGKGLSDWIRENTESALHPS